MKKTVSVIIPTYSRPDSISRAIDSVLSQTYSPIEIIVVDDNGAGTPWQIETEKTLAPYIQNGQIRYIRHPENKNGAAARNTGFQASTGEYVTFLDDDDVCLPQKIEKQVNAIEHAAGPKVAMAYCGYSVIKNGKVLSKRSLSGEGNYHDGMLLGEFVLGSGSNLLIKREAVARVGGYDEAFMRHQDTEFTIRLSRYYDVVAVPEILLEKYNDSTPRRPSGRKYLQIEEQFLEAFRSDIDAMSPAQADKVRYASYFRLALCAANERDLPFLHEMMKKAEACHGIPFKDHLRILKNIVLRPKLR